MRKNIWSTILLIFVLILFPTSCRQAVYSKKVTNKTDCLLKIVYKRGQYFYATEPDSQDTKLYVFTSAGQPVYDQEGNSASATLLKTGQIVNISYDGYILETYPLQLSGISAITVKGVNSNSIDFLVTQISGMFPSTKPAANDNWEIVFKGDNFLADNEKRIMEYILKENWIGAQVTVVPEEEPDEAKGQIQVICSNLTEDSVDLELIVKSADPESTPSERKLHAYLSDGSWKIG